MVELVHRAAADTETHRQEHHADNSACEHQLPLLILHPHQLRQLSREIQALARGEQLPLTLRED